MASTVALSELSEQFIVALPGTSELRLFPPMLQKKGIAAGTVSHSSALIGDSADTWSNGVISHVNPAARKLALKPGLNLRTMLIQIISR
jgi:hypothetical protein